MRGLGRWPLCSLRGLGILKGWEMGCVEKTRESKASLMYGLRWLATTQKKQMSGTELRETRSAAIYSQDIGHDCELNQSETLCFHSSP